MIFVAYRINIVANERRTKVVPVAAAAQYQNQIKSPFTYIFPSFCIDDDDMKP